MKGGRYQNANPIKSAVRPIQSSFRAEVPTRRPVRKSALNTAAAATRHLARGFMIFDRFPNSVEARMAIVHVGAECVGFASQSRIGESLTHPRQHPPLLPASLCSLVQSGTDHVTIKFNCSPSHTARNAAHTMRRAIAPIDPSDAPAKSNSEHLAACAASAGPRKIVRRAEWRCRRLAQNTKPRVREMETPSPTDNRRPH